MERITSLWPARFELPLYKYSIKRVTQIDASVKSYAATSITCYSVNVVYSVSVTANNTLSGMTTAAVSIIVVAFLLLLLLLGTANDVGRQRQRR